MRADAATLIMSVQHVAIPKHDSSTKFAITRALDLHVCLGHLQFQPLAVPCQRHHRPGSAPVQVHLLPLSPAQQQWQHPPSMTTSLIIATVLNQ